MIYKNYDSTILNLKVKFKINDDKDDETLYNFNGQPHILQLKMHSIQ